MNSRQQRPEVRLRGLAAEAFARARQLQRRCRPLPRGGGPGYREAAV